MHFCKNLFVIQEVLYKFTFITPKKPVMNFKKPTQLFDKKCLTAGLFAVALATPSSGVEVHSELLFLVDVSRSVNSGQYSTLINSIAQTFESSSVIDSLTFGGTTSVAASLVFWSASDQQEIAVPWLQISDLASAQQFANLVSAAVRPFTGAGSPASALNFATTLFGTETGGVSNGFESARQSITLIGGSRESAPGTEADVAAARDSALAAGVDQISAITTNGRVGRNDYYRDNVLGAAPGGQASITEANLNGDPRAAFEETFIFSGTEGAPEPPTITSVPEPSSMLLLGLGGLGLAMRRRRNC